MEEKTKVFNSATKPVLLYFEVLNSEKTVEEVNNISEEARKLEQHMNEFYTQPEEKGNEKLLVLSENEKENKKLHEKLSMGIKLSEVDSSVWPFGETWLEKKKQLREKSIYGNLPNWDLHVLVLK